MIWPMMNYELGFDPLGELHRMQREVNRLFNERAHRGAGAAAVNVWTTDDQATVVLAAPDLEAKDLALTVEGRSLLIEGERKAENVPEQTPGRVERETGRFQRQVRLPFDVAIDQVKATCSRGLVTITLPRSEQSKPRRITVESN